MKPIDEFQEALEQARQMTPAERFTAGAELFDYACDIARAGIRNQNPGATEADVLRILKERLEFARRMEMQR
jgi:hypothetical protein